MSQHNLPQPHSSPPAPVPSPPSSPYLPSPFDQDERGGGFSVQQILGALRRHKLLLFASAVVATGAAYGTWRLVNPEYVAEGNLWVEQDDKGDVASPISEGALLGANAWIELLRSYAVLDPVVLKEKLYLETPGQWHWLFSDFELAERFRPGEYRLTVSDDGKSWTLMTKEGLQAARGAPGDSIGQAVGFRWQPRASALQPGTDFKFTVVTPRDASRKLSQRLQAKMDKGVNFIGLSLRGDDPVQIASVLNSLMDRHVELARELKRRKLDERRKILEQQLDYAQNELSRVESELESFRVATVTLPTDPSTPIAPGLEQTRDPVFNSFFTMKVNQEQLGRDRERLQAILAGADSTGAVSLEALEAVPSVQQSAELKSAIDQLVNARSTLRALRTRYEEAYRPIQDLEKHIHTLESQSIPGLVGSLVSELKTREATLAQRISAASVDLSKIPVRSIEEARLRRQVDIQEKIYNDLRQRVETTRLAADSSIPDVSILDRAAVPNVPANDQRIRMILMVAAGILGTGAAGAVFLDRLDPTLRDASELERDVGIRVLGAVPTIGAGKGLNEDRVLEAFRELRMNVEFAYGQAGPVVVTISSATKSEGKSLVSANLAVAFADIGRRTLLVDGDTRRGDVHTLLEGSRKPGLTDYLVGERLERVIQTTRFPRLDLIGSGSRKAHSPELLAGDRMRNLLAFARGNYEVIIVDSPPLTAGADSALLAALTGSLALVVRSGSSEREMVLAKLEGLRRFPIRVLGAVLNDFAETGRNGYYYYSNYLPGYEAGREDETDEAATPAALIDGSQEEPAGVV